MTKKCAAPPKVAKKAKLTKATTTDSHHKLARQVGASSGLPNATLQRMAAEKERMDAGGRELAAVVATEKLAAKLVVASVELDLTPSRAELTQV